MILDRWRSLTWPEVRCRTRQRLDGWIDIVSPAFDAHGQPRRAMFGPREPATPAQSLEAAAVRFFGGAGDPAAAQAETLGTDAVTATVARAEQILAGAFDVLGYRALGFGDPIDWHFDPVSGRRAPRLHWSRIDALDATLVGDSKVIWELNRHQWMVTLAQAYRLTGDARFATGALDRLQAWTTANPYPVGINWTSSLEVAMRLIAWSWSMLLLRDAVALTADRVARWQTLMAAHAGHVERYLSLYYSPNTHLTGEALGLFYAGVVLAGRSDAARWRDRGRQILIDELVRQVRADGIHFEQATCYQRYTADIYLHFVLLTRRNHLPLPADVEPAVRRLVHALLLLTQPDGRSPNVGDADGGWLLPLTAREARDARGTFGVAAAVLGDPECAWAAGGCPDEVLWLCGVEGRGAFERLTPRPPAAASALLEAGGYAVMRTGWTPDAHQLIVDVGPLGCPISGAHGHADLLSLQCAVFGHDVLVDPGTYCYTGDPAWRRYFRESMAHSTLLVDARSQARAAGPFSWRGRPAARLRSWTSTASHDIVDGCHDGFASDDGRIRHRRRVIFLKPHAWVVIDDVSGTGAHDVDLRFQFAPEVKASASDAWIRADVARGVGLWIHVRALTPVFFDVRAGCLDPIEGWVSPVYGVRVPAPVAVASTRCGRQGQLITVMVPERPLSTEPPALEWIHDAAGDTTGLRIGDDDRLVHFSEAEVAVVPGTRQRTA